jgi:putative ABC transport system permease protein
MPLPTRFRLAWKNLTHDRGRCVIRTAGVAFAVFLMFAQLGFWNGLLDAQVALLRHLDGQVVLVSPARYALNIPEKFPRGRLAQARAVHGVAAALPLYIEYNASFWKTPGGADCAPAGDAPNDRPIRLLAFDPDDAVLDLPELRAMQGRLRLRGNALFDRKSRQSDFGCVKEGDVREVAGRDVTVAGLFTLGTDFATSGTVAVGEDTYAALFGGPALEAVDLGVVRLEDGADPLDVRERLKKVLPPEDVDVLTREEYVEQEQRYWQKSTPMGFIFGMGLAMGFVVGAAICYQILVTDVLDHLAEFATLKAIGHRDSYLRLVVLQEGLCLAVLGFVPGAVLSGLLYLGVGRAVGWPMEMTVGRLALVFASTVAMCSLSGLLALRKVEQADPAEVF